MTETRGRRPTIGIQLNQTREELAQLKTEFEAYKKQVRDVAIEVAAEQGWCDDGLNERLQELGLEPMARQWEVTVTLLGRQEVKIRVTAASDDAAAELAREVDETALLAKADPTKWVIDEVDADRWTTDEVTEE